jgi:hypothetical protein
MQVCGVVKLRFLHVSRPVHFQSLSGSTGATGTGAGEPHVQMSSLPLFPPFTVNTVVGSYIDSHQARFTQPVELFWLPS